MKRQRDRPTCAGYAIFVPTFFQGTVPSCYEDDYPVVFVSELEAQREIVDHRLRRLRLFLDSGRDFDDAISTDEFVLPVKVWSDGSISNEHGHVFGKQE